VGERMGWELHCSELFETMPGKKYPAEGWRGHTTHTWLELSTTSSKKWQSFGKCICWTKLSPILIKVFVAVVLCVCVCVCMCVFN
jgi:hypothetical protein